MPVKLYVIRHGETEWSLSDRYESVLNNAMPKHLLGGKYLEMGFWDNGDCLGQGTRSCWHKTKRTSGNQVSCNAEHSSLPV
jgi:hypothetical protein